MKTFPSFHAIQIILTLANHCNMHVLAQELVIHIPGQHRRHSMTHTYTSVIKIIKISNSWSELIQIQVLL